MATVRPGESTRRARAPGGANKGSSSLMSGGRQALRQSRGRGCGGVFAATSGLRAQGPGEGSKKGVPPKEWASRHPRRGRSNQKQERTTRENHGYKPCKKQRESLVLTWVCKGIFPGRDTETSGQDFTLSGYVLDGNTPKQFLVKKNHLRLQRFHTVKFQGEKTPC